MTGFLQDADAFGIRQANEGLLQYAFETLQKRLVYHLVQELEVVHTVVECPFHKVFYKFLFQFCEAVKVVECHLGFNHPELRQMPRRVAVLRAERGTEGVYLA